MSIKRILVIAGSDSSGGAGLEADQKVIAAHGGYAMTATTALTAQNTLGVVAIHEIPAEFVEKQIDACIEDIGVDVIKTGMLASAETIGVVADAIRRWKVGNTIVDPVMVSTSGSQLLPQSAVKTLLSELLPVTRVLTPNLPEAKLLLNEAGIPFPEPKSPGSLIVMAKALQRLGPEFVLLKGGHLPFTKDRKVAEDQAENQIVLNVLASKDNIVIVESEYLTSNNTHGTGCSLASAIASNLANGLTVPAAVKAANRYVEAGIKHSQAIGKGSGPINHFHSTPDVQGPWKEHTEHIFVQQMADGTLPLEKFKMYLIQDYLFLIQFARANALAAYKSTSLSTISRSAEIVLHIQRETALHLTYCSEEFSLSLPEILTYPEHQACTAYTRYVLDIGQSQDFFALQIALLPCLLGYGVIARRLYGDPMTKSEGNRYWKWVENYVAEDYLEAVRLGKELVEKEARGLSVSRVEELVGIFVHATRMETGFWDMGMAS